MSIYKRRRRINYRKIYEEHYGPIPVDEYGRTYEIHHIDGNPENNDASNLAAYPIREHYDIHYRQGDWGACLLISRAMEISPEEKSELSRQYNLERVAKGTHNFLDSDWARERELKRVRNGTHHWLREEHKKFSKQRELEKVEKEIHPFLGGEISRKTNKKRVKERTHNFLGPDLQLNRLENGTHNFIGLNEKRIENGTHNCLEILECPHCGKVGKGPIMFRHHFHRCRSKI